MLAAFRRKSILDHYHHDKTTHRLPLGFLIFVQPVYVLAAYDGLQLALAQLSRQILMDHLDVATQRIPFYGIW
jgi:hypothetical protein